MNTRELLKIKRQRDQTRKEYQELAQLLRDNCHHPEKYIKYERHAHNDEYGSYWYTSFTHSCTLCGNYLGKYKETEYGHNTPF